MVSENNHFINPVGPIGPETPRIGELKPAIEKGGETTSFKDLFKQYINDVNNMQRNANESIAQTWMPKLKAATEALRGALEERRTSVRASENLRTTTTLFLDDVNRELDKLEGAGIGNAVPITIYFNKGAGRVL